MITAVMKVMATNETTIETVNTIAQSVFEKISIEVQKSFKDEIKKHLIKNAGPLIVLAIFFVIAIILQIYMSIKQVILIKKS